MYWCNDEPPESAVVISCENSNKLQVGGRYTDLAEQKTLVFGRNFRILETPETFETFFFPFWQTYYKLRNSMQKRFFGLWIDSRKTAVISGKGRIPLEGWRLTKKTPQS